MSNPNANPNSNLSANPTTNPTTNPAEMMRAPTVAALPAGLARALAALPRPLLVAYSGGADSTALLLACARTWPGQVRAVHVHHGLQAAADDFVACCQRTCLRIGVALHIEYVDARAVPGQSPEDAARMARYEAISRVALDLSGPDATFSVALAHHADDQVETILLALTRGAGLPGISGMAQKIERGGVLYFRPLLKMSARQLRDWLGTQSCEFVEDPSNAQTQLTRNRIRSTLLPLLNAHFPQFRGTFARSARHAAQAHELLVQIAAEDLAAIGTPPNLKALRTLSLQRQANLLRYWLKNEYAQTPSTAQLNELLSQVAACITRGHRIDIRVGTGVVKRRGTDLHWYNPEVLL